MWLAQKMIDTAFSIAYLGMMFVTFSVGMVWYRQEGMLYHPNVPNEHMRYP